MQIVQEGGRILYLKAKNTIELMEWYKCNCSKIASVRMCMHAGLLYY